MNLLYLIDKREGDKVIKIKITQVALEQYQIV